MGRENKKEAIAALHRERIMAAAEVLFSQQGYEQTTISDISQASEYSRRTIYSYYESKEDILHHIIEKGLIVLKSNIEIAINNSDDFITQYKGICTAIRKYHNECPHSLENVTKANASKFDFDNLSDTVKHILNLGSELNSLLEDFIRSGQERGIVQKDVIPMMTVYVLWSGMISLLSLAQTKGEYISKQFSITEDDFLDYGFKQIINSILEIKI